ncbi:uncharacterized protein LOC127128390 [Lathyrus oleraceus]|uniref:uncharacterized protein LOC127128390 n=1 Tax=Pisum sativum TaxID=3888 RepID=UPI0021D3A815|nr:uncharacterized protein LOC127128390 [Pisum sativum]
MITEGTSPANTTTSVSTSLNEVGKLFGQLFGLLLAIIGFASVNKSKENSLQIMALAFMVTLFYMVLLLVTVLQLHVPFMIVILFFGIVVSLLALMIISVTVGLVYLGLWIFIFLLVVCFKYRKVFYEMIPKRIKNLFERSRGKGNVEISCHNLELSGVESLPV